MNVNLYLKTLIMELIIRHQLNARSWQPRPINPWQPIQASLMTTFTTHKLEDDQCELFISSPKCIAFYVIEFHGRRHAIRATFDVFRAIKLTGISTGLFAQLNVKFQIAIYHYHRHTMHNQLKLLPFPNYIADMTNLQLTDDSILKAFKILIISINDKTARAYKYWCDDVVETITFHEYRYDEYACITYLDDIPYQLFCNIFNPHNQSDGYGRIITNN